MISKHTSCSFGALAFASLLCFLPPAANSLCRSAPCYAARRQQAPASQQTSQGQSAAPSAAPQTEPPQRQVPRDQQVLEHKPMPPYDPFHASKSIEVGRFYMRKGDFDAAIGRFQDAIRYKPDFALPRRLIGDAYEKKHDPEQAIKYYKEYLQVLPGAPDSKKIQSRIQKLTRELANASSPSQP